MNDVWLGLLIIYFFAASAASWFVVNRVKRKLVDPFFAIFFVSALIYLELAPTLALTFNQRASLLSLPAPTAAEYALIQTLLWVAFLGPLWFFYRLKAPERSNPAVRTRIVPAHWKVACAMGVVLPALYLGELLTRGIVFQRVGTLRAAQRVIDLPTTAYAIIRLFEDSAYFLAAIFMLLRIRARSSSQRLWATAALVSVSTGFMIPAAVNSRLNSATFLFSLVAWRAVLSPGSLALTQAIRRTGLAALVAALLFGEVALNARRIIPPALVGESVPAPSFYSPLGPGEGLARLDCVDLIARTEATIFRDGPALGAAWQSVPWLVRRYVDPVGFDAFRATGRTTGKGYMLRRYLGVDAPDYYSCSVSDQFGNFWIFGFLLSGVFFGLAFQIIHRTVMALDRTNPRALLAVMFFASAWLQFEKEASSMLFGWLNVLPILLVLMIFPPIRRVDLTPAESAPCAGSPPTFQLTRASLPKIH